MNIERIFIEAIASSDFNSLTIDNIVAMRKEYAKRALLYPDEYDQCVEMIKNLNLQIRRTLALWVDSDIEALQ